MFGNDGMGLIISTMTLSIKQKNNLHSKQNLSKIFKILFIKEF
jgi:hypothetical protein